MVIQNLDFARQAVHIENQFPFLPVLGVKSPVRYGIVEIIAGSVKLHYTPAGQGLPGLLVRIAAGLLRLVRAGDTEMVFQGHV